MTKKCIGCEVIKESTFPFINEKGEFYIDSEGCIEYGDTKIYYCPVCGKKLKK